MLAFDEGGLGNRLTIFSKLLSFAATHNLPLANISFANYANSFESTQAHSFLYFASSMEDVNLPPAQFFTNLFRDFMLSRIPPEDRGSEFEQKLISFTPASLDADTSPLIRTLLQNFGTYLVDNLIHRNFSSPDIELFDTKRGVFNLEGDEFLNACSKGNLIILSGWDFFARNSYKVSRDFHRNFFNPVKEHKSNIKATIARAKRPGSVLIGVHIRKGDYKTFQGGKFYFELAVYNRIMHEIINQLSPIKCSFFVSADEKLRDSDFPGLTVTFGSGLPIEDMYTLAECDYAFGPPSTFSGWASFLNQQLRFDLLSADMPAPPVPGELIAKGGVAPP